MENIRSKPYTTKDSRDNFDRIFRKKKITTKYNTEIYKCSCGQDIYLCPKKYKKLIKKLKLIDYECECRVLITMNLV